MRRWFACAARSINTLIVTHTKKILSMHVPCLTNLYQSTDSHPSQKDRGEWTRGHFPLLARWNLRNSSVPHGICAYLKRRRVFSRLDNVRTQLPSEARTLAKVLEGNWKNLKVWRVRIRKVSGIARRISHLDTRVRVCGREDKGDLRFYRKASL